MLSCGLFRVFNPGGFMSANIGTALGIGVLIALSIYLMREFAVVIIVIAFAFVIYNFLTKE